MVTGKENKVQAAIQAALQEYCRGHSLQLFPPYANQQGSDLRKYCGDLFGLVDNADLIALEIKELDVQRRVLPAFDPDQHEIAKQFERLGVPLAYAYAAAALPYYEFPHPDRWAERTLAEVKRSPPTPLPNGTPDSANHQSMLDWLNGAHGTNAAGLFGRVHGAVRSVDELRNGILVLLYGVSDQTLAALSADDIVRVVKVLERSANLSPADHAKLRQVLAASADVFDRFASRQALQRPPERERDGPSW